MAPTALAARGRAHTDGDADVASAFAANLADSQPRSENGGPGWYHTRNAGVASAKEIHGSTRSRTCRAESFAP